VNVGLVRSWQPFRINAIKRKVALQNRNQAILDIQMERKVSLQSWIQAILDIQMERKASLQSLIQAILDIQMERKVSLQSWIQAIFTILELICLYLIVFEFQEKMNSYQE
jgi:hypothetical protein